MSDDDPILAGVPPEVLDTVTASLALLRLQGWATENSNDNQANWMCEFPECRFTARWIFYSTDPNGLLKQVTSCGICVAATIVRLARGPAREVPAVPAHPRKRRASRTRGMPECLDNGYRYLA